jgi:hypothetical protein
MRPAKALKELSERAILLVLFLCRRALLAISGFGVRGTTSLRTRNGICERISHRSNARVSPLRTLQCDDVEEAYQCH